MPTVLDTVEDGVAIVTMNRPERLNAMNLEMMDELVETVHRYAYDNSVGCVVLTGAGKGFSAGGDIKGAAERHDSDGPRRTQEEAARNLRRCMEVSRLLHEMEKPTVAAINGSVAGAALSMALACDLRVAASGAKITTAFAKVALSGDYGGSYFLSRLVGTGKARELYYLSDILTSEDALALGIVNKVVPKEDVMKESLDWAHRLASGPRVTLSFMKKNMNLAEEGRLAASLDQEARFHSRCGYTADSAEAARAFVEKRTPNFQGR
ncbi:MAG: enoyl-CoA hydratase [Alphaproteobacteria bacterium]|nr:enoyl-CoA hydratase [Alphaproteobacteria bacterium]